MANKYRSKDIFCVKLTEEKCEFLSNGTYRTATDDFQSDLLKSSQRFFSSQLRFRRRWTFFQHLIWHKKWIQNNSYALFLTLLSYWILHSFPGSSTCCVDICSSFPSPWMSTLPLVVYISEAFCCYPEEAENESISWDIPFFSCDL